MRCDNSLFLLQAKLKEMDREVRQAIRRRNQQDQLLFVALMVVLLFLSLFLITRFIF